MLALLSSPYDDGCWPPCCYRHRFRPVQTRLYLQRRNGGAPTRVSRALLSISTFTAASAADGKTTPNPNRSSHLRRRPLARLRRSSLRDLASNRREITTMSRQRVARIHRITHHDPRKQENGH
jgi:hypothetical protein